MRPITLCCALALTLAAGCSIGPPAAWEDDPALTALQVSESECMSYDLALAPVTRSASFQPELRSRPGDTGNVVLPGRTSSEDSDSEPGRSFAVLADMPGLQRVLFRRLDWSQMFRSVASQEAESRRSPYQIADEAGARLLMQVELLDCSVRYAGSAGLVWWLNLLNYFTWSPPFTWWVPDETFAVDLSVRVTINEVRTKVNLYDETFATSYEAWLNEFMHGWLILSVFRTPGAFDTSNWLQVFDQLYPHAVRQLEVAILTDLRDALPSYLNSELTQRLFVQGTDEAAQTFAIVVGGSGNENTERDARAAEDFLLRHGVAPRNLQLLTGPQATPEAVLQAIGRLQGDRTVLLDRVVFYFSGQGSYAPETGGQLACGSEGLSLEALRGAFDQVRSEGVLFLLDTSFGGSGGRTNPISASPPVDGYLAKLGDPVRGWRSIVAARANEAAHDLVSGRPEEQYGLMTYFLTPEREPRDLDNDKHISVTEIFRHLTEQVPPAALSFTGFTQNPQLIGSPELFRLEMGKVE